MMEEVRELKGFSIFATVLLAATVLASPLFVQSFVWHGAVNCQGGFGTGTPGMVSCSHEMGALSMLDFNGIHDNGHSPWWSWQFPQSGTFRSNTYFGFSMPAP